MKFSEHVEKLGDVVKETFEKDQDFKILPTNKKVYIVGSGSSYSQAIFLSDLFNNYTTNPAVALTPYEFVKHTNKNEGEIFIHFSQEAKRKDNICPIKHAKENKLTTILFSSKMRGEFKTNIDEYVDELYWYAPEVEKVLVASMSYVSGYAVSLKYINAQLKFANKEIAINDSSNKMLIDKINKYSKYKFKLSNDFCVFLYADFAKSVAVEGALKVNECYLKDSESYELKHYSHGKHFVSWNQDRIFNVLYGPDDLDLIEIYKKTIFEKHHKVNYFYSDLPRELRIFEWSAQMLWFIVRQMELNKIELEDIPVRDKIRVPHEFSY